jgi:hypothetical protein
VGADPEPSDYFAISDAERAMVLSNSDDTDAVFSFHTDVVIEFSRGYHCR